MALDKNLYHIGDNVKVQFSDEDLPKVGIVDRDSSGRLFLEFPDGSVAYSDFKVLDKWF